MLADSQMLHDFFFVQLFVCLVFFQASEEDKALDSAFRTHLVSARGYYHHLLLQLQLKYSIQLDGIVSWGNMEAGTCKHLKCGCNGTFLPKFWASTCSIREPLCISLASLEKCSDATTRKHCSNSYKAHTVPILNEHAEAHFQPWEALREWWRNHGLEMPVQCDKSLEWRVNQLISWTRSMLQYLQSISPKCENFILNTERARTLFQAWL